VDSAAGRRVKCRRCGGSFNVPGGVEEGVAPPMDLRAMGELERTGQVVATSAESEYEQYKTAVAEMAKPTAVAVKKDYRSIHDLATPDAKKKFALDAAAAAGKGGGSSGGPNFAAIGLVAGIVMGALTIFFPIVALINWIVAVILLLGARAWGTVVAFQDSVTTGFLYLFVPFYPWHYRRTHPVEMRSPVQLGMAGFFILVLNWIALAYGAKIKP